MPDAGEHHGESQSVRRRDDVVVTHGTSRLNYGRDPVARRLLDSIGKGKEGVGGEHGSFERQNGFHGAHFDGIHTAHLSGANAHDLSRTRVDDGVRFDVLGDSPAELESGPFFPGRRALGFDLVFPHASVDARRASAREIRR